MSDQQKEVVRESEFVPESPAVPQKSTPVLAPLASAIEKVVLRHPLTGDVKTVDGTPEELIPLMGRGYSQVKGQ